MALASGSLALLTFRYWNASLMWHHPHKYAGEMTNAQFAREVRDIANDYGKIGVMASILLDDYIHNERYHPLDAPGELVKFQRPINTVKECNHESLTPTAPATANQQM